MLAYQDFTFAHLQRLLKCPLPCLHSLASHNLLRFSNLFQMWASHCTSCLLNCPFSCLHPLASHHFLRFSNFFQMGVSCCPSHFLNCPFSCLHPFAYLNLLRFPNFLQMRTSYCPSRFLNCPLSCRHHLAPNNLLRFPNLFQNVSVLFLISSPYLSSFLPSPSCLPHFTAFPYFLQMRASYWPSHLLNCPLSCLSSFIAFF